MAKDHRNTFEYNVLTVASGIGLLRAVLEVIRDLTETSTGPDFYLDLCLVVLFIYGCYIGITKRIHSSLLVFSFYVPFVGMMIWMFFDGEGLVHSSEINIYASIIIISLTLNFRWSVILNAVFVVAIFLALVAIEYQYHFLENFIPIGNGSLNFIFSSFGTIAFILYAKNEFVRRKKSLASGIKSLHAKNREITEKNSYLLKQKEDLEQLTTQLDEKVRNGNKLLRSHKNQMEQYLSLSITELYETYENTIQCIDDLEKEEDDIVQLIIQSGDNLKKEMSNLSGKIEEGVNEFA
ncbi:hypothetical protein [Ekhidna sp.]|uniref:hypothetical protein n=1 Tax=Ekhidna sp. TaxID=2608089 RepID=UPI003C7E949D